MIFFRRSSKSVWTFLILLKILIFVYYLSRPNKNVLELQHSKTVKKFSPSLTPTRLNKLFQILYNKELTYEPILNQLGVISFRQLIDSSFSNTKYKALSFLKINNSRVEVKEQLFEDLHAKSIKFSFKKMDPLNDVSSNERQKPVILMASDHKYFRPLIETIKNVKLNFVDTKLIIYDLGMTYKNKKEVKKNSPIYIYFTNLVNLINHFHSIFS